MIEITMPGRAKNALGTELFHFLAERFTAAGREAVLLEGAGDAFSAGLDLRELLSLDEHGTADYLRLLEKTMALVYQHPAPVVVHVGGHAIAGGCILALCGDHRVVTAEPRTRIGLNEVALGVRFPPRVLRIARQRIPRSAQETVLLGAGLHPPEAARALGLVDEVAADARSVALARLAALEALPRDAYADTKRALRGDSPSDLATDAELDAWLRESVPAWTSPAVKAKIASVLKR